MQEVLFKCEKCNENHDGTFGSGRFCTQKCASSFATVAKRDEINKKVSKKLILEPYNYVCQECGIDFLAKNKNRICCGTKCASKKGTQAKKDNPPDWSRIHKEAYKTGRNNGAGEKGGQTKWYSYKDIKIQGSYELRICKLLDQWKENNFIQNWEYTKDRFPYVGIDEKEHTYLLDFKVWNNTENFYYIESKGFVKENDLLKWEAVRNQGFILKVWMKKDIEEQENKVV